MPVSKIVQPLECDVGLGDRRNMLFSGTVATYGRGEAVVVATGMETEVGRIAGLLEVVEKQPRRCSRSSTAPVRAERHHAAICAVVFAAGLLSNTTFTLNVVLSLFLFAVALAVAAIPEALPAIVTVGLSLGVRRMAAAHASFGSCQPSKPRRCDRDLLRQDRHADTQRDDRACNHDRRGLVEVSGSGYIPEGEFTVGEASSPNCQTLALPSRKCSARGARQ